jgi:hypothetical protein
VRRGVRRHRRARRRSPAQATRMLLVRDCVQRVVTDRIAVCS